MHFPTMADAAAAGAPECFSDEFAHHERHGTLPPGGPVHDAREDYDHFDEPPEPIGPEVMLPGAFLDALTAAPVDGCPDALGALLADARHYVQGKTPRARVEVPSELLAPLAAYARRCYFTWDHRTRNHECRAAVVLEGHVNGIIHREEQQQRQEAQEAEARARAAAAPLCPEGNDNACPTRTCGCPPF